MYRIVAPLEVHFSTATAVPPPFMLGDSAFCGSHLVVTP